MSVYTPVTADELDAWLSRHAQGSLVELTPIAAGIENTNYFVTTQRGRFREHGRWSFLDVTDRERTVVLDLTGHRYRRLALTVDDPETFAANVRERRPDRG